MILLVVSFIIGVFIMAKHNLDLTIINDGSTYETRKKLAFVALAEGPKGNYYYSLKKQVIIPAVDEARKQFGDKYSLKDVKNITEEVQAYDKQMAIELIRDAYLSNPTIEAFARGWFDSVNGNSYHSVTLIIAGYIVYIPMTYGYGEQWKTTALNWLESNGFIVKSRSKGFWEYGINFQSIIMGNKSEL